MPPAWVIRSAREEELPEAFQLLFQSLEAGERAVRVRNSLDMTRRGELQTAGIFAAVDALGVAGAVICLPVQGASALIWPPAARPGGDQTAIEDALVEHATAWLRSLGVRLAQALMEPHESILALPLLRNGFEQPTALEYLRHHFKAIPDGAVEGLRFESYRQANRGLFHQTLEQTYEGTHDCPELNGVRTLDEIIAGHLSQGTHDPERWWLALQGAEPVGVLLLTEVPEWQGWDLSYLGVVAPARRRGIGRALTRKALEEARRAGQAQLTLAVDARNHPARELYGRLGFTCYDRRDVYLALWPAASLESAGK